MSTTAAPDHFTALPVESSLQVTVLAVEEHGFSVEVAGDLDAARQAADPHSAGLVGDDQLFGDAGTDRDRRRDKRRPGALAWQHSQVRKIPEIHAELPGRIHIVLIRQQVGY